MKLIYYRVRKKTGRNGFDEIFEKILFLSCVAAFLLLIIIQTAMLSPSLTAFVESQNRLEGQPLGVEEYLFEEGTISLQLVDAQCRYDLKVLVNGDEAAVFSEKNVTIKVRDGDVVELDTGSGKEAVEVLVTSASDNVATRCVGKKYKAKPGISRLFKVQMDKDKS